MIHKRGMAAFFCMFMVGCLLFTLSQMTGLVAQDFLFFGYQDSGTSSSERPNPLPSIYEHNQFSAASYATDKVIQVNVTVNERNGHIMFNWTPQAGTTTFTIRKKSIDDWTWTETIATLGSTETGFIDTDVVAGEAYEYAFYRVVSGTLQYYYVYAGWNVSFDAHRGDILLIIDATHEANLTTELEILEADLIGDGWVPHRMVVNRSNTPVEIRDMIIAAVATNDNITAVYIFGHVPVPYSGDIYPDGHTNHRGAWPSDVYYGDLENAWTDTLVTSTSAAWTMNRNIPGDGKFDTSAVYDNIDLMVGRVDMYNMPAFSNSEIDLLRQYINKSHLFKTGVTVPPRRALIDDNFQGYSEGFAQTGYRLSSIVGTQHIDDYTTWSGLWFLPHVFAYGCGGGSFTSVGGIATTADYANDAKEYKAIFQVLFGSYFGDWNTQNNIMRAVLADEYGLVSAWAGRPNWHFHHMSLGTPIGHAFLINFDWTMYFGGTTAIYYPQSFGRSGVHVALLGDPTLRLEYIKPIENLTITRSGRNVILTWDRTLINSTHYIYVADTYKGPYTLIGTTNNANYTTSYINDTTFYMVRQVQLTSSVTGSYLNPSLGVYTALGERECTMDAECNDRNNDTIDSCTPSNVCINTFIDADSDGVTDWLDYCPRTPEDERSNVNDHGCPKVRTSRYTFSHDLDSEDVRLVSDLSLEDSHVKIQFLEDVSLVRASEDYEPLDIDSYITTARGHVTLDTTNLPELNKPARITLFNQEEVRNPVILQDGVPCTECTLIAYDRGLETIEFAVPHFTTYEIAECFSDYADNIFTLTEFGAGTFNVSILCTNGTAFLNIANQTISATNDTPTTFLATVNLTNNTYVYYWSTYNWSATLITSPLQSFTVNDSNDEGGDEPENGTGGGSRGSGGNTVAVSSTHESTVNDTKNNSGAVTQAATAHDSLNARDGTQGSPTQSGAALSEEESKARLENYRQTLFILIISFGMLLLGIIVGVLVYLRIKNNKRARISRVFKQSALEN